MWLWLGAVYLGRYAAQLDPVPAARQRWSRLITDLDTLEVEVEDLGNSSMLRSIVTTLTGQHGTQRHRFVGRARSADPRWASVTVASATFPVLALQPPLDAVGPDDAFAGERQARLDELYRTPRGQGWRRAGHGAHWWSRRYVRPALDWDTPADA